MRVAPSSNLGRALVSEYFASHRLYEAPTFFFSPVFSGWSEMRTRPVLGLYALLIMTLRGMDGFEASEIRQCEAIVGRLFTRVEIAAARLGPCRTRLPKG